MANARLEIILNIQGTRFSLDTSGVDTIPITYNVQNIKDITSTQGSYTKSIVVPETPNNRKVFDNITDLNSNANFDPNLRNRAYIMVDSQLVMEGYFQLSEFSIDKNLHKNSYTLVVYSDNNDFYTLLNEDFLVGNDNPALDIDLSNLNHKWDYDNITTSWGQKIGDNYLDRDYTWGYYYPLIDYGYDWGINDINGKNTTYKKLSDGLVVIDSVSQVQLDQMFPAIYARTIWDAIFKQVGYRYNSVSLPLIGFNDLIIPFNNTTLTRSTKQIKSGIFRAGMTTIKTINLTSDYWFNQSNENYNNGNEIPVDSIQGTNQLCYVDKLPFNDTITDPNGDPNDLWDTTNFEFTNNTGLPMVVSFGYNLRVKNILFYTSTFPPKFQIFRSMDPGDGTKYDNVAGGWPFRTDTDCSNLYTTTTTDDNWNHLGTASLFGLKDDVVIGGVHNYAWEIWQKKFTSDEVVLKPGEKVWLSYRYRVQATGAYTTHYFIVPGESGPGWDYVYYPPKPKWSYKQLPPMFKLNSGRKVAEIETDSFIFTTPSSTVIPGQTIDMNTVIPQQIKKRDFILSIIKMFNLIVEPDKNERNTLNIETRDYYYSVGKIKDWSKKIDLNDPIDSVVIGDTQNKRIILKYNDDKDYYNDYYTKSYNQSFGQYIFNNPNQFVVGDNTMEIQFSPTPITTLSKTFVDTSVAGSTQSGIILPKIEFLDNNNVISGSSNMRILYKKWVPLTTKDMWYLNYIGATQSGYGSQQFGYPYSGYLDDPYTPTKDLNFGQVYPAFEETNTTLNTLYYAYWKQQLEEMVDKDSRIITGSFYLTPEDIVDFKFNDTIFLDFGDGGQYYRVNSIQDYDPSVINTCKVELFRTKNITVPKPIPLPVVPSAKPSKIKLQPWKPSPAWKNGNNIYDSQVEVIGSNNDANFGPSFIIGNNNSISGKNTITNGGYNVIKSNNSFTHGDFNTIYSGDDSFIAGDFNTIQSTNSAKIIGNNNTVKPIAGATQQSSVVIIGDNHTATEPNRIYLGQPTVFVNNYIAAGKDEILYRFSENSNINYISAGRDQIRDWGEQNNINIVSAGRDDLLYDNNTLPIAKSPYITYP